RPRVPGGAAATGRRARTPGRMRHAGNSITVRGPHARQTSTTTATGGRLARGAAAKIAALEPRLSAGLVFPGLVADDLELGDQVRAGDAVVRHAAGRGADRVQLRGGLRRHR